jgi:tetratricopeptide (TPR) repeat protein
MYWIAKPAQRILDLNQALESNPEQTYLFKERAAEYYRLRNYVQAIADYDSYLATQPDDASVLHLQGLAYEQIGQLDRAQENYRRATELDPELSDAYINRAVTFGKSGQFRQAIASLTESIRLKPQNPDGYFNRAMIYFQQGDVEKAIEDLSIVIRLSPGDEAAYYWRGICNEKAGRQGDAIADYKQFLATSQDAPARSEIEQKLSQWNNARQSDLSNRGAVPTDRQKTSEESHQDLDLYGLIVVLGERALNSIWYASDVDADGEKAEELYTFTNQKAPVEGHDLLEITSGIYQMHAGDFQAFDPGATYPWIFIRVWGGKGFYVETNDPKIKERLENHFQSIEKVEDVTPPYEGLFIPTVSDFKLQ